MGTRMKCVMSLSALGVLALACIAFSQASRLPAQGTLFEPLDLSWAFNSQCGELWDHYLPWGMPFKNGYGKWFEKELVSYDGVPFRVKLTGLNALTDSVMGIVSFRIPPWKTCRRPLHPGRGSDRADNEGGWYGNRRAS